VKSILLSIVFLALAAFAQGPIPIFGKCTLAELQMKSYAKDTAAEAVVLSDIGKSFFSILNDELVLCYERTTRIKIFTKAGLKWAQIEIPYFEKDNKLEEVFGLRGITTNLENGAIRTTPLNIKTIYDEKGDGHWQRKKFALPDVKEGSVIDVSYVIRSPYFFNYRDWEFQSRIPVLFSEYSAKMIPFYEYTYIVQGTKEFDESITYVDKNSSIRYDGIDYPQKVYLFTKRDVPAFTDESFISSDEDYIIKINFQLSMIRDPDGAKLSIMPTWQKLSDELLGDGSFGNFLATSKRRGKEIIDSIAPASKSTVDRAKAVDRFVKATFNWNEVKSNQTSKTVKEFLTSKTGNSAEINLFLTGMLSAAGIQAFPVLLSTRDHGRIKSDYPFLHFFNYVVALAKIDENFFLLDATDPLCDFGQIPARCLNDKGLIVQKKVVEWVNLKSALVSGVAYTFELRASPKCDSIEERCTFAARGYDAADYRTRFVKSYKNLKTTLLGRDALEEDSLKPENLYQTDQPFTIRYRKKSAPDKIAGKMIISPFCNTVITENPLKQASRTYPVDMTYRSSNIYLSKIVVPKGYKLLTRPEAVSINNDRVKIAYTSETYKNDSVKVIAVYEFKKEIYAASDYPDLKGWFNTIVEKLNEKLVFVRL
jgi:hypothetical protein